MLPGLNVLMCLSLWAAAAPPESPRVEADASRHVKVLVEIKILVETNQPARRAPAPNRKLQEDVDALQAELDKLEKRLKEIDRLLKELAERRKPGRP